jgi:hypothetical protein
MFDPLAPSIPAAFQNVNIPSSKIKCQVDPFSCLLEDKVIDKIDNKDNTEFEARH